MTPSPCSAGPSTPPRPHTHTPFTHTHHCPPTSPCAQCHRQKLASGEEKAFPVNALAFHPVQGTFATGGGDGVVCVWDHAQKKRVATLAHPGSATGAFPNSIASLDFSPSGARLAIAASYGWEQGDPAALPAGTPPPPPDAIFVRDIAEADVKPKAKK